MEISASEGGAGPKRRAALRGPGWLADAMRDMIPRVERAFLLKGVAALAIALVAASISSAAVPRHVAIPTPGFPGHIASGFGAVWVISHRGGFLYRIDPARNRVTATIDVSDALCWVPAVGAGAVWVANCGGLAGFEVTYKVDPRTNRVLRRVPGSTPVFGAGSLWTALLMKGMVYRIDPESGIVLTKIRRVGFDTRELLYIGGIGYGSAWIGSNTTVARIATATNKVTEVIRLPRATRGSTVTGGYSGAAHMAFAMGKVWIAVPGGVYIIDPSTNQARRLSIPIRPFTQAGDIAIVASAGSVWVRTSDRKVVRIDVRTGRVDRTYPASGGGGGLAVAFGSLWVANAGDDTVWRIRLH
jgi:DNA-binding beta-propeller fold protein YncE